MVEPGGVGNQMPLADDGRPIAGRSQQLGKCLLRAVEAVAVGAEAIGVAVLPREDGRAAGAADGIAAEAVIEDGDFKGTIYVAGPLFSLAERRYIEDLVSALGERLPAARHHPAAARAA